MALQDYTYRLKAESGDVSPVDEVGGSITLSGGTISLVDMGGGDYAWQFAGLASAAGPLKNVAGGSAGSGVTIALRIAVTSYDASGFAFLAGYTSDTTPSRGLVLGQNGANAIRSRWVDSANDTLTMLTVNTAVRTVVLRTTILSGTTDKIHAWVSGVTGSGDTADYISPGQNYNASSDLDTLFLGSSGSTIRVSDYVVWGEELSDANCHTLAESGIRATLDAGGGDTTISCTVGNAVADGATATITNGSEDTTISCAVGNAVAAGATATIQSLIMSEPLINNTGTVLASTSVSWSWLPAGRIGSLSGITAQDGTGTTDSNGRLVPGVAVASGILMVADLETNATDDAVYYQGFAV